MRDRKIILIEPVKILIFMLPFILTSPIYAEPVDLGVYGSLYPIKEVDLLDYIKQKAKQVNPDEVIKMARENFERSLEVSLRMPEAKQKRVRYVDPSITVSSPVYDHKGNIIASQGKLNPLEKIQLSKTIVVLKESQLNLIPELKKFYKDLLILLTDGNLVDASKRAGQMVYRSDNNILSRLGVEKVPSVIIQEGTRLKVEEIPNS